MKVDQAGFTADLRALPNRADREKVMSAFFNGLGIVQPHVRHDDERRSAEGAVLSRRRGSIHRRSRRLLDGPNIPTSVYTRLIDGVNKNLPAFHRYLKLRKRMMGLDQLHYYDLYAPLVGSVNLKYTPEEAQKHVLAAVAPLGAEYQATISARVRRTAGSICFRTRASARARIRTAAPTTSIRTC